MVKFSMLDKGLDRFNKANDAAKDFILNHCDKEEHMGVLNGVVYPEKIYVCQTKTIVLVCDEMFKYAEEFLENEFNQPDREI
jgi:hypothetical protein